MPVAAHIFGKAGDRREARHRVHFVDQEPAPSVEVEEVDPSQARGTRGLRRLERPGNAPRPSAAPERRAGASKSLCLVFVLRGVVVPLPCRVNLTGERGPGSVQHGDFDLSAGDEFLDDHLLAVSQGNFDGALDLERFLGLADADR